MKLGSRWSAPIIRRGAHLFALDALAAMAVTTIGLVTVFEPPDPTGTYPVFEGWVRWAGVAAVLAMGPPLAVRRRWPLPVLAVVLIGATAADLIGVVSGASGIAAFALYWVAASRPASRSVPALAVCATGPPFTMFLVRALELQEGPNQYGRVHAVIGLAVLGSAWLIGYTVRRFRRQAADLAEERTAQRLAEERLRITRELHDVVSHTLSLVAVKAGVANHVAARRPDEAREALQVIERISRSALTEVRQILGVLRRGEAEEARRAPIPSLRDLPELVERAGAAGVRVTVRIGDLPSLTEGAELTIYRIVQEAVTNVVRHAEATECRVALRHEEGQIVVEVIDDGTAHRPGSAERDGHGLMGMRERVAVYGGELSTGFGDDGGFRVVARIPDHTGAVEAGAHAR